MSRTRTAPDSEAETSNPTRNVTTLIPKYNIYPAARSTNDHTDGFRMAFDGLLMREFGFRGIPARLGFSSARVAFMAFGFMAFDGFSGFESHQKPSKATKSHQKRICRFPDVATHRRDCGGALCTVSSKWNSCGFPYDFVEASLRGVPR